MSAKEAKAEEVVSVFYDLTSPTTGVVTSTNDSTLEVQTYGTTTFGIDKTLNQAGGYFALTTGLAGEGWKINNELTDVAKLEFTTEEGYTIYQKAITSGKQAAGAHYQLWAKNKDKRCLGINKGVTVAIDFEVPTTGLYVLEVVITSFSFSLIFTSTTSSKTKLAFNLLTCSYIVKANVAPSV